MTTIGYATLQLIPSLSGVSDSINKQLGFLPGQGKKLGAGLGDGIASGLKSKESAVRAASDALAKARDRERDATDKTAIAEAKLAEVKARSGAKQSQILSASAAFTKAQRAEAAAVEEAKTALANLNDVKISSSRASQLGAQVGSVVGKSLGAGITAGLAVGTAGIAAAVGGIGLTLTKGFQRLESIDSATFKLKALGHSAGETKTIMDSALASVKGTSFGLDEAATTAASAVAAGIKPGKDLTKYLTDVADASAVAGTSLGDMGTIFNSIQTQNKAYTGDLQQLSDRGIPIFQWLAKEYGVTGEALAKMVSNGEVDAAHFQQAIETNIGGAAKTMGQSFAGSVQNAEAALGRLGAAILAPVFNNAAGGIGSITGGLDKLTDWVKNHQTEVITFFKDMGITAISVAQDILKSFGQITKGVGDFVHAIGTGVGLFDSDKGAQIQKVADSINGVGDGLINTATGVGNVFDTAKEKVRQWGDVSVQAAQNALNGVGQAVTGIATSVGALPFKKVVQIDADTKDAITSKIPGLKLALDSIKDKTVNLEIKGTTTGTAAQAFDGVQAPGWLNNPLITGNPNNVYNLPGTSSPAKGPIIPTPHRAMGGQINGPGTGISDSILARVSNGEYIVNADATRKNLPLLEIINSGKIRAFATGGHVGPDVDAVKQYAGQLQGGKYVRGGPAGPSGTDCSGAQAWMANFITGGSGRFATGTEREALLSRGFTLGDPPPGVSAYWVGWKNGGPGGGHTAGTIVDPTGGNVNVEMGGSSGGGSYGGGAGASGFPSRAWIALASAVTSKTPNGLDAEDPNAPTTLGDASASSSASTGGIGSLPSSLSGLSSFGLDSLGAGVGKTKSGSDLSAFGKAAGTAVSGQVASALGVFGLNDTPPILNAASQLLNGIKVAGKDGTPIFDGSNPFGSFGSAAPLSATSTIAGAPPPDDAGNVHGLRAGQRPGPGGDTYNITATNTEEAINRLQKQKDQNANSQLSRF